MPPAPSLSEESVTSQARPPGNSSALDYYFNGELPVFVSNDILIQSYTETDILKHHFGWALQLFATLPVHQQKPPGGAEQVDKDHVSGCSYSIAAEVAWPWVQQNPLSKGMEVNELEFSHEFH